MFQETEAFLDAVGVCNLTLAQASGVVGRTLGTMQAYASGKRRPPEEVVTRLIELWQDAATGTGDRDRYGELIPVPALAIRRLRSHPAMSHFEILRDEQHLAPMPDPDATPFVAHGEVPDDDVPDRDDDLRHPSDGPPIQDGDEDEEEGEGETP